MGPQSSPWARASLGSVALFVVVCAFGAPLLLPRPAASQHRAPTLTSTDAGRGVGNASHSLARPVRLEFTLCEGERGVVDGGMPSATLQLDPTLEPMRAMLAQRPFDTFRRIRVVRREVLTVGTQPASLELLSGSSASVQLRGISANGRPEFTVRIQVGERSETVTFVSADSPFAIVRAVSRRPHMILLLHPQDRR